MRILIADDEAPARARLRQMLASEPDLEIAGEAETGGEAIRLAVELKPDDPTINDHLGDAYWRVGRVLEAHFQWSHAKDLKPEPEDLAKIEEKLKAGLPDDTSSAADAAKSKKVGNGG